MHVASPRLPGKAQDVIKETPASRIRVVLAFVGTGLVALLPLVILSLADAGVRGAVSDVISRHVGLALMVGATVITLLILARAARAVFRRRFSAASI